MKTLAQDMSVKLRILKSGFASASLRSHSMQLPQGARGFNATGTLDTVAGAALLAPRARACTGTGKGGAPTAGAGRAISDAAGAGSLALSDLANASIEVPSEPASVNRSAATALSGVTCMCGMGSQDVAANLGGELPLPGSTTRRAADFCRAENDGFADAATAVLSRRGSGGEKSLCLCAEGSALPSCSAFGAPRFAPTSGGVNDDPSAELASLSGLSGGGGVRTRGRRGGRRADASPEPPTS